MNQQLALAIGLYDQATFTDFCWQGNTVLKAALEHALQGQGDRFVYLWGNPGSGKSHLLQACCANESSASAIYLPLKMLKEWGPQVLDGIENQDFIGIDDLHVISAHKAWEEALFHAFNRIRDQGRATVIMTANAPPAHIPLQLADLQSRLNWGLIMQLNELHDDDKIQTLQRYAAQRGFELPRNVGQYLLSRCGRTMHELYALLNRLDEASLVAQRKITIPFVKSILSL